MHAVLATFRRLLLDRRFVLVVLLCLALTTAIGLVVPQNAGGDSSPPAGWANRLGVTHLFSGWWFRAIILLAAVQLLFATVHLVRRDVRRVLRARGPGSAHPIAVSDSGAFAAALARQHYRRVRRSARIERYVRNPWGYAGPALLHAGMVTALAGGLLVYMTTSSAVLTLLEGDTVLSGIPLDDGLRGPLADSIVLDDALTLQSLDVTYWPDGGPRGICSTFLLGTSEEGRKITVGSNEPITVNGLRIFQDPRIGYAYGVTLDRNGKVTKRRLDVPSPESAAKPSYLDVGLENGDLLRAKVVHDPTQSDGAPVLTLRIMRGQDIVGDQSFSGLGSGMIGDTEVSVDIITRWTVVVLEESHGMGLLFTSFFVMLLGAGLIYMATPRELTLVKREDGTVTAEWHAVRFSALYESEERSLRAAATGCKADEGE